jgi:antitoxin YefM
MSNKVTYTTARANFAKLCDEVAENSEVVIINRRGAKDVALVAADELAGLMETAHLLRSPRNARRLLTALQRAQSTKLRPQSVKKLRQELGIEPKK